MCKGNEVVKIMKNYIFFLVFVHLLHFGFGTDLGDVDTVDGTGCPRIFLGKCTCKRQNYLRYEPTRNDTLRSPAYKTVSKRRDIRLTTDQAWSKPKKSIQINI